MKTSFSSTLGAFAALILLGTPVLADSTEIFSSSFGPTDLSTSTLNDSFTLNAFNPSLGSLIGVTLTLDLTTTASPQIFNTSGTSQTYANATTYFFTTLTGPDGTTDSYKALSATDAGTVTSAPITTLTGAPVVSSTNASVLPGNLSAYVGTSPLSFSVAAPNPGQFTSGGTETSGAGALFFGGTGTVGGTAEVQYDYLVTPEPSAWALAVACMGLFTFLRFGTRRNALN